MAFDFPKQNYNGKITTLVLGTGPKAVRVGGTNAYPFHVFEGEASQRPKIAMEVWDYDPSQEWPEAALEPFRGVLDTPVAWARKCVQEFQAELIVLQLKSTDPNGLDVPASQAAEKALDVMNALDVPVMVWGTANHQKDEEVLKLIAEKAAERNVALGPVEEANHKGLGASALAYGHTVAASSPIDVNLAKQLNILVTSLGVAKERILIDPTTGGLGYGLEYSYSVMERIRMAALTQEDDKLQMPMINLIGPEVWKTREAGLRQEEAPSLGDPEKRGILMEVVSAICYLLAGSDLVVLRHPESVRLVRLYLDLMFDGGSAKGRSGIAKRLPGREATLASLSVAKNMAPSEKEERSGQSLNIVQKESDVQSKTTFKQSIPRQEEDAQKAVMVNPEEREKSGKSKLLQSKDAAAKTPAAHSLDLVDKMSRDLDRIHGRVS